MGEATLNRFGDGLVKAYSAGSKPAGQINPYVARVLEAEGYDTSGFRSKSWDEFSGTNAPMMDVVITVCDNAAGETCPVWIGAPVQIHCGFADPATIEGDDVSIIARTEEIYQAVETFAKAVVKIAEISGDDADLRIELQKAADTHQMLDR